MQLYKFFTNHAQMDISAPRAMLSSCTPRVEDRLWQSRAAKPLRGSANALTTARSISSLWRFMTTS